jgi:hypothetical protein
VRGAASCRDVQPPRTRDGARCGSADARNQDPTGSSVAGIIVLVTSDLHALMRRDHDDLDRGLAVMVDRATPLADLGAMLDVVKLALAVHVAAEAKVFDVLLATIPTSVALRDLATTARDEHALQQRAIDVLSEMPLGSEPWFARTVELRVHLLDHATRELAVSLHDHAPAAVMNALAREYATERMRVLARTAPVALARARLADGYGGSAAR